ncbi:MAG TPA: hypothetical protein VID72_10450 [Ktedonobacterales bacterium]
MSETTKPYLHMVRSAPTADAEGAEEAEESASSTEGSTETSIVGEGQPAVGPRESEPSAPGADSTLDTTPDATTSGTPLNQPLQQAIMYAAVSWVALMVERSVHSVDIQPIARRLYEVSVHYSDAQTGGEAPGEGIILRIALAVEPGLVVRTSVEPVRP